MYFQRQSKLVAQQNSSFELKIDTKMHHQTQSRLLQLPAELQLTIFEFAIIENEQLLLNYGCDSSYGGSFELMEVDKELWDKGEILPPLQPGLTRTCKAVRTITLPMFYEQNVFRSHYCHETDFNMAVKWMDLIGPVNRHLIRDICLWDKNPQYDWVNSVDIIRARRNVAFRAMGGTLETLKRDDCCCHRVMFGCEDTDYFEHVPQFFEGLLVEESLGAK